MYNISIEEFLARRKKKGVICFITFYSKNDPRLKYTPYI